MVSLLCNNTSAPAITAPVVSRTVPLTEAVTWASVLVAIDKNNARPTKIHRLEVLEEILRVIEAPPRDPCLHGQYRGSRSQLHFRRKNPKSTTADGQRGRRQGWCSTGFGMLSTTKFHMLEWSFTMWNNTPVI